MINVKFKVHNEKIKTAYTLYKRLLKREIAKEKISLNRKAWSQAVKEVKKKLKCFRVLEFENGALVWLVPERGKFPCMVHMAIPLDSTVREIQQIASCAVKQFRN